MAQVRAVLGALWTAGWRNRKSLASFSGNNLYYAGFTLLFFSDSIAFIFFLVIMGIVVFFPLSSDPMRAIPQDRLSSWPLGSGERRLLRVLSPWLNPLTWVVAILLIWKKISIGLWAMAAGLFGIGFLASSLPSANGGSLLRRLPMFPGPLNQLIRKNLREMVSTLDFYVGILLAVPAFLFRIGGKLPQEAFLPLTLLIVLAISTHAQSLMGLDGTGGLTRYRLLPIAGWQILVAKDAPFLFLALLLTLALSPVAGLAAALIALAVGHRDSVTKIREQTRWRFQTSGSLGGSLFQMILMIFAGVSSVYASPLILLVCIGLYAGSAWWFGRELEREPGS